MGLNWQTLVSIITVAGGIYGTYKLFQWRMCQVEKKVDKIMNNHLPHIDQKLEDVRVDVAEIKGILKNK